MSIRQRILFPLELSLNFQMLSATTRKMIDRADAEIVMLHAVEEASRAGRGMEVAQAMARMEFLMDGKFERAKIIRRAERGNAAECIVNYAENHDVDTIVMPAGGLDSLRRNSLGQVTEAVLSTAPCDVWVDWMTGSPESARHICCAVGLDGDDEAVLFRAAEIADRLGAKLTIIHAVAFESPMTLWWDTDAAEQELRLARMQVDELRRRYAPTGRTYVEAGHSDTVVSRALHRLNAGLLVVSHQGPTPVAAAMACPVFRVAPAPAAAWMGGSHSQYTGVLTRTA